MELNVDKELALLGRMSVDALRARYAEVFHEGTNGRHKQWLIKRIIWRLQSLAEGDLSERARLRAAELANDADLRRKAPTSLATVAGAAARTEVARLPNKGDCRIPLPGSVITRIYKGETLQVKVLADGFEYGGDTYKSLSAVAKHITQSHCNGYLFFQLAKPRGEQ